MIPTEVMWHAIEQKHIHKQYICTIKDIHDAVTTSERTK